MRQDIHFANITVDCKDAQQLCDFYASLLGWDQIEMYGFPAARGEHFQLLFIGEADYVPPVWPEQPGAQQKQMHFDFQVPDVPAAVRRAESLGATVTPDQFGGPHFTTLLDPAGHPFCLCAQH